ncbi:MAG: hypothetical protein ABJF50_13110 [Paracoccaceae bacterium]
MTLTISEANSNAPLTKEDSPADAPTTKVKKAWSSVAKRFWEYTEATGESNTKPFEGLL